MEPMKPMQPMKPMEPMKPMDSGPPWWPQALGQPATSGGQNDTRYAFFPEARRLAVQRDGKVTLYDTGEHRISGVQQQQGGTASLAFSSQQGTVRLEDLKQVD
ncbi:hypothetical protein DOO78_03490 [Roseicella frigidaeris]|uniref:Uncharacterized protein n=2 Tax=Roseicella frigidaeris TaxID=2230885 RepID=A0A327MDI5_9PROT|nr:hypothetical protein DOO78_03490 [Roseicella frigidaeris]